MALNIFIGWSGWRSGLVARKLATWLPEVIPGIETWISDNIRGGTVAWFEQLNAALRRADFAVMCVLPENWGSPWMSYEPGVVLGKTQSEARIWPYVIDPYALRREMPEPLKFFWAEKANYDGTLKLVQEINKAAGSPLSDKDASDELTTIFEGKWAELKKVLDDAAPPPPPPPPPPAPPAPPGLAEYIDDFMRVSRCIQVHQHRVYGSLGDLIDRTAASVKAGTYDRAPTYRSAVTEIQRSKAQFANEPSLLVGNVASFFAAHYTEDDLGVVIDEMELALKHYTEAGKRPTSAQVEVIRISWRALMKQAVLEVFLDFHAKLVDELRKVSERPADDDDDDTK